MLPASQQQQLDQRRNRLAQGSTTNHDDDEQEQVTTTTTTTRPTPAQAPQPPRPHRTVSTLPGEKTCWICYESSLENPDRPFIHACSCTLLSHPDCLLEWLNTRSQSGSTTSMIPRCPVCATLIIVRQDTSRYLKWYRQWRRRFDKLSIVAAIAGVAGGAWIVASAYGLWALRVFMGERVAKALLLRNSKGIPFRLWLNLPLIPFALILSRTPLIDSLLPFLPLTLALSTHTTSSTSSPSSRFFPSFDPLGLDDLTLRYPPSPTLTICLLPWFRILYCRTRHRIFEAVLGRGSGKRLKGLAGMMEEAARDELSELEVLQEERQERRAARREEEESRRNVTGGRIRGGRNEEREEEEEEEEEEERTRPRHRVELVAELEIEFDPNEVQSQDQGHPLDGETDNTANAATNQGGRRTAQTQGGGGGGNTADQEFEPPAPSSLRIGIDRLTSLLVGALIYPALSSIAGSCLYYLATKGSSRTNPSIGIKMFRNLLGISSIIAASSTPNLNGNKGGLLGGFLSNPFLSSPSTSSTSLVDPVWIRNSIGGGLVLILRDCFELWAGVLEQRRKKSRRIVERPVGEGLSLTTQTTAAGGESTSSGGGRNVQGREAIVHNYL